MPVKTQFHDYHGQELTIARGNKSILLEFQSGSGLVVFCLDPNDFGDVAAALWECSPTKQPITITSTPTQGDTARRADEAGYKSQDSSSTTAGHTMEKAEAKDVDRNAKARDAGIGSGQTVDSRVERTSEAGS